MTYACIIMSLRTISVTVHNILTLGQNRSVRLSTNYIVAYHRMLGMKTERAWTAALNLFTKCVCASTNVFKLCILMKGEE